MADRVEEAETARLAALHALRVLDTPPEAAFDGITRLAARLFDVPISLISFVDRDRQWFKSHHGLDTRETPRSQAFCAHAIGGEGIFEIVDPLADPRFADNPLVTGPPHIRYYAGAPLTLRNGQRVGTLCLIGDRQRRPLTPDLRAALTGLADLAVLQLEERRLRETAHLSAAIADATPDAIICASAAGAITHWNPAAERLFGWSAAEALGGPLDVIIPLPAREAHHAGMRRLLTGGEARLTGRTVQVEAIHRDGRLVPVELSLAAWRDRNGGLGGFGAIIRDARPRKAIEADQAQTRRFLDAVIENLPGMLFVKDAVTRRYLLWNRGCEEITGHSAREVVGRSDEELFGDGRSYAERDAHVLASGKTIAYESTFRRPDGSERMLRTRRTVVRREDGAPLYLVGMTEDLTEWRAAQERLAFLSGRDGLTHLANRDMFMTRLAAELAAGQPAAMLVLDIDRFHAVNEQGGRQVGDLVLVALANELARLVEPDDVVARIAADEFAMLFVGAGAELRAGRLAERLGGVFAAGDSRRPISVSAGIALAPDHGADSEALLSSCDIALERARKAGGGRYCFFDAGMDETARLRRRVEAMLPAAIASGEFFLHYQPVAATDSGRIVGLEALARWASPQLGSVPPSVFIPVAEECGLIGGLGELLLGTALAEAAGWSQGVRLAVNLSRRQIDDEALSGRVIELIRASGIDPARVELEITESVLERDAQAATANLKQLKSLGVSLAMDDFGTGYASIGHFAQFPFDKVKIDQSFIRHLPESGPAQAVVQAVIGLARGFGLEVVAEGVETEAQMAALQREGCQLMQGHLFGKAQPIEALAAVVGRGGAPPRCRAA